MIATQSRSYRVPPVVLMIFNRPDTVREVMRVLAEVQPDELFVVADGPREGVEGDLTRCALARAIATATTWPCRVRTAFASQNLGDSHRFRTGLAWVFEHTDRAVILEDDCVPDPTFFRFCSHLLDRYAEDPRIGMISGNNLQFGRERTSSSYYFSRYTHIWGWATWARAWQHFDLTMSHWPAFKHAGRLAEWLPTRRERAYWTKIFDGVHDQTSVHWDYAWTFTCWDHGMLTILPDRNLVSNIGFGEGATNTHDEANIFARMPTSAMPFPLHHPEVVATNNRADAFSARTVYLGPTLLERVVRKVRHVARGLYAGLGSPKGK